jgi:hypothetical protein
MQSAPFSKTPSFLPGFVPSLTLEYWRKRSHPSVPAYTAIISFGKNPLIIFSRGKQCHQFDTLVSRKHSFHREKNLVSPKEI